MYSATVLVMTLVRGVDQPVMGISHWHIRLNEKNCEDASGLKSMAFSESGLTEGEDCDTR